MKFTLKIFLTLNATSLLPILYLVKEKYVLAFFAISDAEDASVPQLGTYLFYIIALFGVTYVSILVSRFLPKSSFSPDDIIEISIAHDRFLPSYLGYFFVALSVPDFSTLAFTYAIVFVFTFVSQTLYFNPLYLIFGYNFYTLRTRNGADIFLVSRRNYKLPAEVVIPSVGRINDYTFIEGEIK